MRLHWKKYLAVTFLAFIICLSAAGVTRAEQSTADRRVLFISSYSYAWETVPQQISGIQEAFGDEVTVDYKFMDTKNMLSQESADLFYQSMKQYLLEVQPYDGIILGDDAAFQFALEHQEELFFGIPIVFEGVNNVELATEKSKEPLITGVVESLSYDNTLRLATELYPGAGKIVAILDDSITGESERIEFYSHEKDFPQLDFSEINASHYSREELADKVAALDTDTILLYIMCSTDAEGHAYTSEEAVNLISSNAEIPTFSILSIGMGYGILGGEMVSHKQMGFLAAEMLKQYFSGTDLVEIQLALDSPRQFTFDEKVMRRFGLKASQMPKDSEIVNHEETLLERNKQMVEIAVVVVMVLLILLCILAVDNVRRRRLNDALKRAKENLEFAAHYDALTKLKNRRVFMEELQNKIDRRDVFGLILFDIDNFKNINDSLGHNNGDLVLRELAERSRQLEDVVFEVYRLAGDEFTAIVSTNHAEIVRKYAQAVQGTFARPFILEGKEYFLHSSIGIAMYPKDGITPKDMVAAADEAMYRVKNNGKDNIAFYKNT